MSTVAIHQLVHGYSKGHSLLAGSCRLSKKSLDIVAEQSDLSGPLPAASSTPSYLTAYPLADSDYFALGRTWPDLDAPRSGCVITHTLLIPKALWASTESPQAFLRLHKLPDRSSLDAFKTVLSHSSQSADDIQKPSISSTESRQFVAKVFRDGLRSVVWFDCQNPDALFIAFVKLLWPAIRLQLYANTYSLQARARIDSELQLHFAPRTAQSRFSRLPKECLITKGTTTLSGDDNHEWMAELASYLESGSPSQEYIHDLREYGHLLGTDPTAIRNLFLLRDLTSRLSHTPMAAVGILDIIESLEPSAEGGLEAKQRALDTAITAAKRADSESALHCLALVDARLRRPSFATAGRETYDGLLTTVVEIVSQKPQALFSSCAQGIPVDHSPFWDGVRGGLSLVATQAPQMLLDLGRYPELASFAVRAVPNVARSYLQATSDDRQTRIGQVVEWIRRAEDQSERRQIRVTLLHEAHNVVDIPLLEELLRDLQEDEVGDALDSLLEATQGFANASVRRVLSDYICERFPTQTIRWGVDSPLLAARHVPEVLATAFAPTTDGCDQVLQMNWNSPEGRCEIWSAFVNRLANNHFPQWFMRRAADDPAVIEPFVGMATLSTRAIGALEAIGNQCDYIPIARSACAEDFVRTVSETQVGALFAEKVGISVVVEHMEGRLSDAQLTALLNHRRIAEWWDGAPTGRLHDLLVSSHDAASWQRGWTTLSVLPQTIFQRVTRHRLISAFSRSYRANWTKEVAQKWSQILERGRAELPHEEAIRLLTEALTFCFNNASLPVGIVVLTAFPPVYEAVTMNNATQITDELFGYFDWDKAKKLRKDVIESYTSSVWPPEDLAIIATRSHILRKVFSRLRRKWKGEEYLSRMVEGLRHRESDECLEVRRDLTSMMEDAEFFEPWD